MRIEQVGFPVFAVIAVDVLYVGAHVGGQQLCYEEYEQSSFEGCFVWVGVGSLRLTLLLLAVFARRVVCSSDLR
jgi:hypothetical protein